MRLLASSIIAGLLLGAGVVAHAAPAADLSPRWQAHDAASTRTIDNSAFDRFLSRYVVVHDDGPNGVRYDAVTDADAKALASYIDRLEAIDIDAYNRNVQRAYWINLYNAVTLSLVIDHWPVDSIRQIDAGLLDSGPWDEKRVHVEHVALSLNDIEHHILRPIWADGMTHYGVNCASISCPSLNDSAYTGANVNDRLAANARAYIASPQGVRFDGDALVASKIYQWYGSDFADQGGVLAHLKRFASGEKAKRLADHDRIDRYVYDWHINSEANIRRMN